jgi:peptidase E
VGKILLLSNGFGDGPAKAAFDEAYQGLARVKHKPRIIVIPSGIPLKQQGDSIKRLMADLALLSSNLRLLDLHQESIETLKSADVCVITGGNPYILLRLMRKRGFAILSKILNQGGLIVGSSGGAMVLGGDITLTPILNPSIKRPGNFDLKGLGLFEENVFPHFNRFLDGHYEDRRQLLEDWLAKNKHYAISDNQFVMIEWIRESKPDIATKE